MDLFHGDFSFFGIQNHETKYMVFVHKRFSVARGLRPPDPPAEFGPFFLICTKNKFFCKTTFFLVSLDPIVAILASLCFLDNLVEMAL